MIRYRFMVVDINKTAIVLMNLYEFALLTGAEIR
jgi:hypothetical protein